jgi:hypothetical protein
MATNKTTETTASVKEYISNIADEGRRKEVAAIVKLMQEASGLKPKMWGAVIVGFGSYHYKYASGREGDAPKAGLASRSNAIVLYFALGEKKEELLAQLGKHKIGGGCIYIKSLSDIDKEILGTMTKISIAFPR